MVKIIVSFAALVLAVSAKIPQLQCGPNQPVNKIGASVDLDGPPEYMATINGVGNATTANTFTVTANMTVTPSSVSCSPADLMIQFIGNGPGSFRPHEFMYPSKEDSAQNVVFKVTDTASSFDWIAISQEGSGCDYLVTIHTFTIDCLNPDGSFSRPLSAQATDIKLTSNGNAIPLLFLTPRNTAYTTNVWPPGAKYQCYQGTCKSAVFGVAKEVCDAICH
eukprot:gene1381-19823_t